ncbi:hypothetical protein GWI33_012152 [Rhynchophorus ferrugineus]|uniref:Uncharacterized protein n=1 Tax=Rhynchophorus ferrugineus TaxID=354439 RepID=A0A834IAK8_RHYFE|nr:hypothetical protein GWI33_012152 [Rhynchophorus ferrugineus]
MERWIRDVESHEQDTSGYHCFPPQEVIMSESASEESDSSCSTVKLAEVKNDKRNDQETDIEEINSDSFSSTI